MELLPWAYSGPRPVLLPLGRRLFEKLLRNSRFRAAETRPCAPQILSRTSHSILSHEYFRPNNSAECIGHYSLFIPSQYRSSKGFSCENLNSARPCYRAYTHTCHCTYLNILLSQQKTWRFEDSHQ